jgi:aryl-alcohol dehydrogenase-like predicted oxidoreductase
MSDNRLALGTVQFGQHYGVANTAGQIGRDEAAAILAYARMHGLVALDTAIAYGESEYRLGEVGVEQWQVTSKLPMVPKSCVDIAAWVRESTLGSLRRLRIPKLSGLLLHRSRDLCESRGKVLYRALEAVRDQGLVEKIGVSIYDPEELDALSPQYPLDLVQAPFNILDRRLVTSGWLARLHREGKEVHVRSVFLQGLLLMPTTNRPVQFNHWQVLWDHWRRWLDDQMLTPLQACLGYVLSQPEVDRVVVGVDSLTQLQAILASAGTLAVVPPNTLMSEDQNLINPSYWGLS